MTCNFLRLLQSKAVREIEIVIRQVAVTTMKKVVEKSRELLILTPHWYPKVGGAQVMIAN